MRPQILLAGLAAAFVFARPADAAALAAEAPRPKKILFYSKSSQYEDPMVRRVDGHPSIAETILGGDLSKENGFTWTFTKDGSVFTPEKLAGYDAFCFFTSGDLTDFGTDNAPPMTPAGKTALLDAIRHGKGFVGIHSAAGTFPSRPGEIDPFIAMLGGELRTRVRGLEPSRQFIADKNFPGIAALPPNFQPAEEWYVLNHFATNLHVILIQDTGSMVRGSYYAPDYPSTWARSYGRGRVFYTSMGHQEAVWRHPAFQSLLAGALNWATGKVEADITPNIATVTPKVLSP
jgi:uncharacterized protein